MKIAYIMTQSMSSNSGVTKKILQQIKVWSNLGVKVKLFAVVRNSDKRELVELDNLNVKYIHADSNIERKILTLDLIKEINKFNPDIIYYRQDFYSLHYEILSNKYKIIVELQTKDKEENYLVFVKQKKYGLYGMLSYMYFTLTRNRFLEKSYGIVTVTQELQNYYSFLKKPSICIPNGIDIESFNIIKKADNNGKIKLFFIGTEGMPWHGVNLIEKIAEKLPEYEFHIVGLRGENRENVKYYGSMKYEDYIKVLEKCHICIGTLALHRKNMKEASPLKVREYLAHGFPIIIGYKDTAFLESKPDFVLEIDLSDENINDSVIDKIRAFVFENKDRIVEHTEIKNYIDIYTLESKKLKFIENLLFK